MHAQSSNRLLPAGVRALLGSEITARANSTFACPELLSLHGANVMLSPEYYNHALCVCVPGYFGLHHICTDCAAVPGQVRDNQCQCNGGTLLQDCFLSHGTILPCPAIATGQTACNPNSQREWPLVNGAGINDTLAPENSALLADGGWCLPGYQGRLCSQCSEGFYAQARRCAPCHSSSLSSGIFKWLVPSLYLIAFVAIVAFLYLRTHVVQRSAGVQRSSSPLDLHAGSSATLEDSVRLDDASESESKSLPSRTGRGTFANVVHTTPVSNSLVSPFAGARQRIIVSESAAFKIVLFHCQQAGLMLTSGSALPAELLQFLSFTASSSDVSVQSFLMLECLASNWRLLQQLAASLVAAFVLGALFLLLCVLARQPRRHVSERTIHRCMGVLVALINLAYLPSLQLAVSALGCTDTRSGTGTAAYLNLFPSQVCDHHWRQSILPLAVVSLLWWMLVLPLCVAFLAVPRLRLWLRDQPETLFTVTGSIIGVYREQYLYFEACLLGRRLLLVLSVGLIPYFSAYLPLAFFIIIQGSALLLHRTHPYLRPFDNHAELASMYILLLNYFTGIILNFLGDATTATLLPFLVLLLMINAAFILVMLWRIGVETLAELKVSERWSRATALLTAKSFAPSWRGDRATFDAPLLSGS